MRIALAALALAALALLALAVPARAQPEAAAAFEARQADLVALAERLGALHRLQQVCNPEEDPDRFREDLMAIIPLEVPRASTRTEMIDAFNAGYRDATSAHVICGREARRAYAAEAERALVVTERLYAPFR